MERAASSGRCHVYRTLGSMSTMFASNGALHTLDSVHQVSTLRRITVLCAGLVIWMA